jgi:hypothetical protein
VPPATRSASRARQLSAARRAGDVLTGDNDRIGASLLNFGLQPLTNL